MAGDAPYSFFSLKTFSLPVYETFCLLLTFCCGFPSEKKWKFNFTFLQENFFASMYSKRYLLWCLRPFIKNLFRLFRGEGRLLRKWLLCRSDVFFTWIWGIRTIKSASPFNGRVCLKKINKLPKKLKKL